MSGSVTLNDSFLESWESLINIYIRKNKRKKKQNYKNKRESIVWLRTTVRRALHFLLCFSVSVYKNLVKKKKVKEKNTALRLVRPMV